MNVLCKDLCMFCVVMPCWLNLFILRLMGRAAKSYTYDTDGVRLVYKAVGSEQKVYMEPSSNGTAVAASSGRRQNNLVVIFLCMLPPIASFLC